MAEQYNLGKRIWTELDFEQMSWHDCPIHALSFSKDYKLLLDIDYILKWVLSKNKKNYKFWISPCTLVFENVYDIALESDHTSLVILNVTKDNPRAPKNEIYLDKKIEYDWVIETTVGEITFKSVGFNQFIRKPPIFINSQEIDIETRSGLSFSTEFIA